jgi:hypothetical protein
VRSLRLAAVVAVLVLACAGVLAPVSASGNVDAAHACQQGGYANLKGTDGTLFKNTGDCVAFVARNGVITGVSENCSYTAGTSGCVELDNVVAYLGITGAVVSDWTSISGMFSFAPVTSWDGLTTVTVSGSGTWTTSASISGTWTATTKSSIYPTTFFNTSAGAFGLCGAADIRYVGIHLDIAGGGVAAGSEIELGLRLANSGTNYIAYFGFGTPQGEPFGAHEGLDVSRVTIRC